MDVITYPCWDISSSMYIKGVPEGKQRRRVELWRVWILWRVAPLLKELLSESSFNTQHFLVRNKLWFSRLRHQKQCVFGKIFQVTINRFHCFDFADQHMMIIRKRFIFIQCFVIEMTHPVLSAIPTTFDCQLSLQLDSHQDLLTSWELAGHMTVMTASLCLIWKPRRSGGSWSHSMKPACTSRPLVIVMHQLVFVTGLSYWGQDKMHGLC